MLQITTKRSNTKMLTLELHQAKTGSTDPNTIGSATLYYGNSSLRAAPYLDSFLDVYGTDGTQDTPRQWEGFDEYNLVYLFRKAGREFLGNETVVSGHECSTPPNMRVSCMRVSGEPHEFLFVSSVF